MVKGDIIRKWLPEDIYDLTNGGYDIYMFYLGQVRMSMNRPWGRRENHPSWGIFPGKKGLWYWKDQATEETGTALQMVMKMFSLDYKEAMNKIIADFGLVSGVKRKPSIVKWEAPYTEKSYCRINFTTRSFEPKHHAFWNIAEATESHCNKMNCWAVKDAAINGKRVSIKKDEIVFAYYAPEEDACKLYFPEREKGHRFKSNLSYTYLSNFSNIVKCDDMIIQKSDKDRIITSLLQECVVNTQSEAVRIFKEDTLSRIYQVAKTPWLWYGSDPDGKEKAEEISSMTGFRTVFTPEALLPEVNDTYSYVAFYNRHMPGSGLTSLQDFMKLKGIL
jgi:hypothetical protein